MARNVIPRLLTLGVGSLLVTLLPMTALPARAASASSATRSWPDYRDEFLKKHPHYLPKQLDPPAEVLTRAWVHAQGQYFLARSKALARIRRAYLRTLSAIAAPASGVTYFHSNVPAGAIRDAVLRAFGSEGQHALAVMQCEDPTLSPNAIHHDGDGTSDWGLFQINIVYNRGAFDYPEHLLDPFYNIAVAASIYRARGWGDWSCGRLLGLA